MELAVAQTVLALSPPASAMLGFVKWGYAIRDEDDNAQAVAWHKHKRYRPTYIDVIMNKDLIFAAYHGDLGLLKTCIDSHHDVNMKDDSGYTPLHWVSFMGMVGENRSLMARLLIAAGADVNSVLPDGGPSILSTACDAGNYEIVKELVNHGADVNFNGHGSTPLIDAISSGSLGIVSFLLENGADCDAPNAFGETPIDIAKEYDRLDIVREIEVFKNKQ